MNELNFPGLSKANQNQPLRKFLNLSCPTTSYLTSFRLKSTIFFAIFQLEFIN